MADPINTPVAMREMLAFYVERHGETFAALSRMLRRPDGYLARYARDGIPVRLKNDEARLLARYFRIDPRLLGGTREAGDQAYRPQSAPDTKGAYIRV